MLVLYLRTSVGLEGVVCDTCLGCCVCPAADNQFWRFPCKSNAGSTGRVWLSSPAKELGQDQDKSLEKSRNALWKKPNVLLYKKAPFSMGFNLLKFFIPLKALGKILTGIVTRWCSNSTATPCWRVLVSPSEGALSLSILLIHVCFWAKFCWREDVLGDGIYKLPSAYFHPSPVLPNDLYSHIIPVSASYSVFLHVWWKVLICIYFDNLVFK